MKNKLLINKLMQFKPAILAGSILLSLMGFMLLPATAQITTQQKYIYLSGQLTSVNTGAPISDHQIYITSDSLINEGFDYYATTKTDVSGFYRDTLVTTTTDGIIRIYLYDFDNNQIQLDRYYRFVWENEYLMFADFSIFDPNANEELQANFQPTSNPLGDNPMQVAFKDLSIGISIKSWLWDFGDGRSSTVQDPDHVYEQPGVYMVTLTINALPPEFDSFQASTITKQVQVGLREFHHLGGHVMAGYFPIDLGLAYLYTFDEENNLIAIDTTEIDTLGYYYFYEVPSGKYLTKARLQASSVNYGAFMPTYFRNAYDWNDAEEIVIESENNWECNVQLRPSDGFGSGDGQILGRISYDTSNFSRTPIPAQNIEIVLLNPQGDFLTCKLSDTDGYFDFGSVPYGTYQLFPDVAGILTTPMYVTLSADKPMISDVNMVIFPMEITFSINENSSAYIDNALVIYPNPVTREARISLEMKKASGITAMITDLSGKIVGSFENILPQGKQEIVLPVGNLPSGLYQVILIPEDKAIMSGKFLKSN